MSSFFRRILVHITICHSLLISFFSSSSCHYLRLCRTPLLSLSLLPLSNNSWSVYVCEHLTMCGYVWETRVSLFSSNLTFQHTLVSTMRWLSQDSMRPIHLSIRLLKTPTKFSLEKPMINSSFILPLHDDSAWLLHVTLCVGASVKININLLLCCKYLTAFSHSEHCINLSRWKRFWYLQNFNVERKKCVYCIHFFLDADDLASKSAFKIVDCIDN